MSKDEYLITDAPLKALTVFAMPMILGSFFQQVYNMADSIIGSVCRFICTCGCRSMRCSHKCIYLCGTWCRCRCRRTGEPLFWRQRLRQNENDCVDIFDQLSDRKRASWCIRLSFFASDDEPFTNTH